ncbi:MAG: hypothetical protein OES12_05950, partial [Anaerolineae bacterium]|nr:hypothetical protein [Anaerolineae bacterium]
PDLWVIVRASAQNLSNKTRLTYETSLTYHSEERCDEESLKRHAERGGTSVWPKGWVVLFTQGPGLWSTVLGILRSALLRSE